MNALHVILPTLVQNGTSVWSRQELIGGTILLSTAGITAFLVFHAVRRVPWPRPFRIHFVALQVAMALAAAGAWFVMSTVIAALVPGEVFDRGMAARGEEILVIGVYLYAVVAGVSYAVDASGRAARAEAVAVRTQLAALRAQLHPHFLFNALHTIVQLIPIQPARAAEAAELVAELLRGTLEQQGDEVRLGDEWNFVSRYLAVERIRFGDRLVVRDEIGEDLLDERIPAFSLQTLVENAVHHGAAPRVAATEIMVTATASASALTLVVRNTGDTETVRQAPTSPGTGQARLRERLAVLYGSAARLVCGPDSRGGYESVLVVPLDHGRAT